MLNYFEEKKETFLTINSRIFQSPKTRIFFKGVNPWFWPKNAKFFYLDLVKITLQLMLNYFEEKKETFLDYKKREFFKVQKIAFFFSKGLIHTFGQKMPFFLYFYLVKIRLEIMLSDFAEKKETCFDYKNRIFQSPKNPLFQRKTHICFWSKNAIFFSS